MILMITKHLSYSFSCLTPYIFVFCRNEENETKSKQFVQGLKILWMEESMVVTTTFMVATIEKKVKRLRKNYAVWS